MAVTDTSYRRTKDGCVTRVSLADRICGLHAGGLYLGTAAHSWDGLFYSMTYSPTLAMILVCNNWSTMSVVVPNVVFFMEYPSENMDMLC